MKHVLFETDWLASRSVFYNKKTGKVSHYINDVIDYANFEFDPEGFNNYLDFGYSVFEQTPVKDVKFLRYSSRLVVDDDGKLSVQYLDDPVDELMDIRYSEADVMQLIQSKVRQWEDSVEGEIIIPTSGGYDSRLLNWCVRDKSRIRSFTYGLSQDQIRSSEVVYARKLSEILETRWAQIPLGHFHKYFNDWERLYGVATHAHGMYHMEFYDKIRSVVDGANPFLSGIVGDLWAGSVAPKKLVSWKDLQTLGHTHGISADVHSSSLKTQYELRRIFWEQEAGKLTDWRYQIVFLVRLKIILLSYLLVVPELYGFRPWSPFLDIAVAMSMLNLPPQRKAGRVWQREFFHRNGIDVESMGLDVNRENTLDLQAITKMPPEPLNAQQLREVVRSSYVEWINNNVLFQNSYLIRATLDLLYTVPKVRGGLHRLGFKDAASRRREAYNAYLVLLPIQNLLEKRKQL